MLRIVKKTNDGTDKLFVTLGQQNLLSIHHIEPLNCQSRRHHCFPGSKGFFHFDTHPAAHTKRHDHDRSAVEIGCHIRYASCDHDSLVRQLPYLGAWLVSDDVKAYAWDVRLHARKNRTDETHGGIDIGRMSKIPNK